MQLHIQENFTHRLAESLKSGEVDVILIALPFDEPGIETLAVYDEPFMVAMPKGHPWEGRKRITSEELTKESLLLLGEGHCFRDQVLEFCHTLRARDRNSLARTVEGGSLETIRQMVAGGVGITVLPVDLGQYQQRPRRSHPHPAVRAARCPRGASASPGARASRGRKRSRRCARRSSPATCRRWRSCTKVWPSSPRRRGSSYFKTGSPPARGRRMTPSKRFRILLR